MYDVKLIYAYPINDPEKKFLICDLNEGGTFADPLVLFQIPDSDFYKVNKEGLYAIGGYPDIKTLLRSYKWGIFPWYPYKEKGEAYWYCPRQRFIIFPDSIHVTHSLKSLLNKNKYSLTINRFFKDVIHNCRMVNDRDKNRNAWLGDEIENIFIELHNKGYAKSIEVWEDGKLVGGFYGFWYKGIFQGESMFSLRPSASQIGLVLLCQKGYIDDDKIKLIDTQFETPTFKRLGGEYIPYEEYRAIMDL